MGFLVIFCLLIISILLLQPIVLPPMVLLLPIQMELFVLQSTKPEFPTFKLFVLLLEVIPLPIRSSVLQRRTLAIMILSSHPIMDALVVDRVVLILGGLFSYF